MDDNYHSAEEGANKKIYPPLDMDQVDYALREIKEEIHVVEGIPIYKAFPVLLGWTQYFYKKEVSCENKAPLLSGYKRKATFKPCVPFTKAYEKKVEKDPLLRLGFGIFFYLKILRQ